MNQLERIVAATREQVARRREQPLTASAAQEPAPSAARREPRSFAQALTRPGLSVIAEHKRRSPSAGVIREGLALADVVGAYERGGAAALSILTEGANFGGSLEDMAAARDASSLPLLRKDFIVDPYQVQEAVAWGADAILLIVAAVSDAELAALHELALSAGLDALVEVHDAAELERAVAVGARLIGINNRDLTTLTVDTNRTFELLPLLPPGTIAVAESGFSRRDELERLAQAGADAVLIGEALMRAPDIEAACRDLAVVQRIVQH